MNPLAEVAWLFFRLGLTAFGGPAAHIAMMEDEFVTRRQWISRQHFLDLIGATNLIPGPNSTEMTMHLGYERAGFAGMLVAGACFIVPAAGLTGLLAWAYVEYGALPEVGPWLAGIKPAVLAIIAGALWKLGNKAMKGWRLAPVAVGVFAAVAAGAGEIVALLAGGVLGMLWLRVAAPGPAAAVVALFVWPREAWAAAAGSASSAAPVSLVKLGLFFLKVGAILYGSGYVLIAFLEGGLVRDYGWLTQQQLLDAVAAGQFTPGPVLTTATFVGFVLGGVKGAAVATLGIFLPSFAFVAILNPVVPKLRKSQWTAAFLDAVNAAAVALMAAVTFELARTTLTSWQAASIALAAGVAALRFGASAVWLVLGGALAGRLLL
ncbi:MAG: chromate efflux transporter [Bryobacterales bacterium]|nr:chromate efflux transporter [Acidobacteriota bacterium]MCB9383786.1 chromate efflux transporter [Bryobacterales bacterium]